jgi:hypothetical protein
MMLAGSSLQMTRPAESQSDEGDLANNSTLQKNKQEFKNRDNEVHTYILYIYCMYIHKRLTF